MAVEIIREEVLEGQVEVAEVAVLPDPQVLETRPVLRQHKVIVVDPL
jgi:hypothetical protein